MMEEKNMLRSVTILGALVMALQQFVFRPAGIEIGDGEVQQIVLTVAGLIGVVWGRFRASSKLKIF